MHVPVPERLAVSTCLGCGMVEAPRDCIGTCDDRRAELVWAAAHDRALAARDAARRRGEVLAALAERVASAAPGESIYRDLQVAARAALRDAGPAADETEAGGGDRVSGWWCASCGRMEAPQTCLGVCIHRPDALVRLDVHEDVVSEAVAARARADGLAALARGVASSTPRGGHWDQSAAALAAEARRRLGP